MKVYKCDRCGKELAHHDRNRIDTREWDNTLDRLDLCNECFKRFEVFIYEDKGNDSLMAQMKEIGLLRD